MIVGALGKDIIFLCSRNLVQTFDQMQWSSKANLQTIDRHLKNDLLEFCGTELEQITFSMTFTKSLGIDPFLQMSLLLNHMRQGDVLMLIIGAHKYGQYRWCIESVDKRLDKFDRLGRPMLITCDVTLKEYAKR